MGTCSVTCQAKRNHHPVSDKHKQDENLRPFKSNVNNTTKPSYVTGLEEYNEPISYIPFKARPPPPPPLPDCGNVNRSISPISMIKPIRRRNTVTSIQDGGGGCWRVNEENLREISRYIRYRRHSKTRTETRWWGPRGPR
jgi:hypothetical protein